MPFALIGFFLGIVNTSVLKVESQMLNQLFFSAIIIKQLLLVIGAMIFARSAAMAFNRWLDHTIDARNPRTAIREIPSGIIKPKNALFFTIVSCLFFIACCWFINLLCFYLSFVALFIILFYSYTKRFTALCHLVLGLGLSLAPIGAYLAVTGTFNVLPILFSCSVLCWVSGFDIIYALQDVSFDQSQQLHSIPVAVGKRNALLISRTLHLLSALCIMYAGKYGNFGYLYWIGAAIFIALLVYQHILVKPDDLSKVNVAFFTTNGIASIIFCIFVLLDLFISQ